MMTPTMDVLQECAAEARRLKALRRWRERYESLRETLSVVESARRALDEVKEPLRRTSKITT